MHGLVADLLPFGQFAVIGDLPFGLFLHQVHPGLFIFLPLLVFQQEEKTDVGDSQEKQGGDGIIGEGGRSVPECVFTQGKGHEESGHRKHCQGNQQITGDFLAKRGNDKMNQLQKREKQHFGDKQTAGKDENVGGSFILGKTG